MSIPTDYQENFYLGLLNLASDAQLLKVLQNRKERLKEEQAELDSCNGGDWGKLAKISIEAIKQDIEIVKIVMSKRGLKQD